MSLRLGRLLSRNFTQVFWSPTGEGLWYLRPQPAEQAGLKAGTMDPPKGQRLVAVKGSY
jgi:hypothetical protein